MPTAIIAEDEPLLRTELAERLAEAWPELDIVALAEDGAVALEEIAARQPDVAFLDIRMPGMSGIDVAAALSDCAPRTRVVFVTAYQQYAIDAFEKGAVDYLLKPLQADRLAATVGRLKATDNRRASAELATLLTGLRSSMAAEARHEPLAWITAGSGRDTRLIMIDDIAYFQADSKYTVVMTAEGEALIRKPIRELIEELEPSQFKQIHRSTIVNLKAIKSVTRDEQGKGLIRLKSRSETLAVSQPFMHLFRNM
jgi:DNA-binding LytR/AlgR family response regulator